MNTETLTLEKIHRQKRSESATSGDAKRLVEVESAAIAAVESAQTAIQADIETGHYSETFLAERREQHINKARTQMDTLRTDVLEPMRTRITEHAANVGNGLPESRSEQHNDALRWLDGMTPEKQRETMVTADPVLAEALLLDSRREIPDFIRTRLEKIATPEAMRANHTAITDLAERFAATETTIETYSGRLGS